MGDKAITEAAEIKPCIKPCIVFSSSLFSKGLRVGSLVPSTAELGGGRTLKSWNSHTGRKLEKKWRGEGGWGLMGGI